MALTPSDKKWIVGTVEAALDRKLDSALADQEQKFEAKIIEVKNDFYNKIDPILKEVIAAQQEREIVAHRLSDHEDRIEKVEKKLSFQT